MVGPRRLRSRVPADRPCFGLPAPSSRCALRARRFVRAGGLPALSRRGGRSARLALAPLPALGVSLRGAPPVLRTTGCILPAAASPGTIAASGIARRPLLPLRAPLAIAGAGTGSIASGAAGRGRSIAAVARADRARSARVRLALDRVALTGEGKIDDPASVGRRDADGGDNGHGGS